MLADAQAVCLSVRYVVDANRVDMSGLGFLLANTWCCVESKRLQNLPCATLHSVNEVFHQCKYGLCAIILLIILMRQQVTCQPVACSGLYCHYYCYFLVCVLCILLMKSSTVVHVQSIIHSNQKPHCSVASQF